MLPEFLTDENTIYHYTKASTAIKYILPDKTLLFSPRKNSKDPIENKEYIIYQSVSITDSNIEKRTDKDSQAIRDLIQNRIRTNNQICFCLNKITDIQPEDGYKKSRMWNQYGDNFKGVCLAFNRQELLQNSMVKTSGEIHYNTYDEFRNDYLDIDSNDLDKNGNNAYEEDRIAVADRLLLRKHIDYRDECEFRICSFGKIEYLSFDKSLKGILVCGNVISIFLFEILHQYAQNLKIPLINISFSPSGCRVDVQPNGKHLKIINPYNPD